MSPASEGSRGRASLALRQRLPVGLKRGLRTTAGRFARWSGQLARRERQLAGNLVVLTYHRVLPAERCARYPFPSLAMPVDALRSQVAWLTAHGDVLPLSEALRWERADRERPVFSLTFDDGYADSGDTIPDVLESAGARGTFFVTTGFVDTPGLLWFDRAALLLAATPASARREIVGAVCAEEGGVGRPPWDADCARWVAFLKGCGPRRRGAILRELELANGGPPSTDGFESMRVAQVAELGRRGHELGSHTVTHAMLPELDAGPLRGELEDSRAAIAAWTGADVQGFCFPNGSHDRRSVLAVERAGYAYACTTRGGFHRPADDPFRIARVTVAPGRVLTRSLRPDDGAFRRELCAALRAPRRTS